MLGIRCWWPRGEGVEGPGTGLRSAHWQRLDLDLGKVQRSSQSAKARRQLSGRRSIEQHAPARPGRTDQPTLAAAKHASAVQQHTSTGRTTL